MAIAVIDDKGRIQIPEKIREELCLKSGEESEVKTEGEKDNAFAFNQSRRDQKHLENVMEK